MYIINKYFSVLSKKSQGEEYCDSNSINLVENK